MIQRGANVEMTFFWAHRKGQKCYPFTYPISFPSSIPIFSHSCPHPANPANFSFAMFFAIPATALV